MAASRALTVVPCAMILAGEARNVQLKNQMLKYIPQINGTRQVADESKSTGKPGLTSRTNDTWPTTKLKTGRYAQTGADANRVNVVTEHDSVYLKVWLTRVEASRAADIVRHTDGAVGVVKVFEYVG